MTSEHPPTARPQVMLRKHLLLDKAPTGTRTHTHSFYTMTWYKGGREMVLQANDSPLLVTLPSSSSQLLLAAGRGSDSGRLAVERS